MGIYHGADRRLRPSGVPTRGERDAASRAPFKAHPEVTKVRREFADIRGRRRVFLGEAHDFSYPYWQVRYPDGDWEGLNREEIKRGNEMATAPS